MKVHSEKISINFASKVCLVPVIIRHITIMSHLDSVSDYYQADLCAFLAKISLTWIQESSEQRPAYFTAG